MQYYTILYNKGITNPLIFCYNSQVLEILVYQYFFCLYASVLLLASV